MSAPTTRIHDLTKDYVWNSTTAPPAAVFPTRYRVPERGRDPFKLLMRDYARMEVEKDNRVHQALDRAVQLRSSEQIEPRWVEGLKLLLPATAEAEYQAMKGAGLLISSIDNPELQQGYSAQALDEARHLQLVGALRQHYSRTVADSQGLQFGSRALSRHPVGSVARAAFAPNSVNDPIDAAIALNVVLETAYTNPLTVAIPPVASANGDDAYAAAYLSIQSDEVRHMANGHGTLRAVAEIPENIPLVQGSLDRAFWHQHQGSDTLVGVASEYFVRNRPWAYRDAWEEWVVDDFIGSFSRRFGPFGLTEPARLGDVARGLESQHHAVAIGLAALWPLNFFRIDPLDEQDFAWFEDNYPGWSQVYQPLWEAYAALSDPAGAHLLLQELPAVPPFCQVCQLPCIVPRFEAPEFRIIEWSGKKFALCSDGCEANFAWNPISYASYGTFWGRYHGWDLADVILDLGFIRPDGKTLVAQPHLHEDRLWTIDHIRGLGVTIQDPLAP
ncbi:methane monooxygenase [Pseudonocardia sulfidoxydans NBRC 16205]|uniref:propane 2-monooxygenase n=1 Tax=Pseudonocardia sulfidoxydans NBRC 16205 TaxID=1223511 RepID=A0A511DPY6_9PSEU|nr:methane monooxygenase [Pseudonocardia sulfidoxydans]GEL26901.1 methane monooxygenase [Pseudonocardia sulfidoxydans NBRC 16205]